LITIILFGFLKYSTKNKKHSIFFLLRLS